MGNATLGEETGEEEQEKVKDQERYEESKINQLVKETGEKETDENEDLLKGLFRTKEYGRQR